VTAVRPSGINWWFLRRRGRCGIRFIEKGFKQFESGNVLIYQVSHSRLEGGEAVGVSRRDILRHLGRGHVNRVVIGTAGRQGARRTSAGRGGGIRQESEATYGKRAMFSNRLSGEILSYCKGNCGRSGGRKRRAGSVTSRGSKVSLLLIGRLHMAAYLAGDPKRKE
jgi:hypothetical protein